MKIPKLAKEGIRLLRRDINKNVIGYNPFNFGMFNCPIGRTYNVVADPQWDNLSKKCQKKLIKFGWNKKIYEIFISWHDGIKNIERLSLLYPNREFILK